MHEALPIEKGMLLCSISACEGGIALSALIRAMLAASLVWPLHEHVCMWHKPGRHEA